MAQTFIITLTTAGLDTGPFNLYSNLDGFTSPFESNVDKADLLAGYLSELVPDGASQIRVKSNNALCSNYVDLVVPTTTTTTTTSPSTTTTTTTSEPVATFTIDNLSTSEILNVTVGGGATLEFVGGGLPIPAGESRSGRIYPEGNYDITVSGIKPIPDYRKVTFRGSDLVEQCVAQGEEEGNTFDIVGSVVPCFDTQSGFNVDVVITVEDGPCS